MGVHQAGSLADEAGGRDAECVARGGIGRIGVGAAERSTRSTPMADAAPARRRVAVQAGGAGANVAIEETNNAVGTRGVDGDRKSTRLNSSHANISYAVFCLK